MWSVTVDVWPTDQGIGSFLVEDTRTDMANIGRFTKLHGHQMSHSVCSDNKHHTLNLTKANTQGFFLYEREEFTKYIQIQHTPKYTTHPYLGGGNLVFTKQLNHQLIYFILK